MNIFSLTFGEGKENLPAAFSRGRLFESRPQQTAMLQAVNKAISGTTHLLVEAGTGVGKSMAYLLPFIKWTFESNKKVVVSTYTKTLQEQLAKKDLPRLKEILGMDFNFALCLGAANYLCLRRLYQNAIVDIFATEKDKRDMKGIQEWASQTSAGLRSELSFSPSALVWERVCRESDLCLGKKCTLRKDCFYYAARAREYKAHILVTNHHLFFANVASGGAVLPAFEAVVFDEAHTLEQVATNYLGMEVSNFQMKRLFDTLFNPQTGKGLLRGIKGTPRRKIEEVRRVLQEARVQAESLFSELIAMYGREPQTLRIREALLPQHPVFHSFLRLGSALEMVSESAKLREDKLEVDHHIAHIEELGRSIAVILEARWPGYVYWFNTQSRPRGLRCALCAAPIDISREFRKKVLDDIQPVILTSATLSVNGRCNFIKESLGFDAASDELILDSPFDYAKNVLLYLARDITDPGGDYEQYLKELAGRIKEILTLTAGRTVILFTSFRMMNKIHDAIKELFPNLCFLKQGQAPRYHLLEAFKSAANTVLFGTHTFWQGIDIPGKALECVIITKLPFAVPDDPVTEARMEMLESRGKNPFLHYQLPQAVMMLRQGFGRLIRTKTDRGLVAILDPRVTTRHYGRDFLRAIPRCRRIYRLEEARSFFSIKPCSFPGKEQGLGENLGGDK